MKEMTWTWMDRRGWDAGPWDGEPDKEQWRDDTTGLPCLLVRNTMGALCGYVGMPPGHPWFEQPPELILVAGYKAGARKEINYADFTETGTEGRLIASSIAFLPEAGELAEWWMIGFDCGHAWDIQPGRDSWMRHGGLRWRLYPADATYKDVAFVKDECRAISLLAAAALEGGIDRLHAIMRGNLRELES